MENKIDPYNNCSEIAPLFHVNPLRDEEGNSLYHLG